jgi:hypothetical protein
MSSRQLWRLDGVRPDLAIDHEKISAGLARHLQHSGLSFLLVQVGGVQQSYIELEGCPSCHTGRCVPGCFTVLFQRLLAAAAPELRLHPVPRGLAPHPYTQLVYARPLTDATPLDASLVAPWPEAQLRVQWRTRSGRAVVAALLATGNGDTAPAAMLKAQGWHALWLPSSLARLRHQSKSLTALAALPFTAASPFAPYLLIGTAAEPAILTRPTP